ncbi:MAG: hypothetical protein IJQ21_10585 [Lachnospiraceae bacterium]|nr:hypothetical protein [Lachnospiraceae bacterium]
MSQALTTLVFVLMCVLGGLSSLYVVIALPVMTVWKIYRKARYGERITG